MVAAARAAAVAEVVAVAGNTVLLTSFCKTPRCESAAGFFFDCFATANWDCFAPANWPTGQLVYWPERVSRSTIHCTPIALPAPLRLLWPVDQLASWPVGPNPVRAPRLCAPWRRISSRARWLPNPTKIAVRDVRHGTQGISGHLCDVRTVLSRGRCIGMRLASFRFGTTRPN